MHTVKAEGEIVDLVSAQDAIDSYIDEVEKAAQQYFIMACSSMRLMRFKALPNAVAEAIGSWMQLQANDFSVALSKVVRETSSIRFGPIYAWSENDVLVRAMYETVVRELLLVRFVLDQSQFKVVVVQYFGDRGSRQRQAGSEGARLVLLTGHPLHACSSTPWPKHALMSEPRWNSASIISSWRSATRAAVKTICFSCPELT
eukprot:6190299-Pleurochrysis_carterae.AAC.2